jgi:hypothetical protein
VLDVQKALVALIADAGSVKIDNGEKLLLCLK